MEERNIDTISLDGGWPCLDFINTVHDRTVENPFDYISDYGKFLEWSVKVEVMSASEKKLIESKAGMNEKESGRVHDSVMKAYFI